MPTTPARTTIVNALDTVIDAIAAGATYNTTPSVSQYRTAPFTGSGLTATTPAVNIRALGQGQPTDLQNGAWNNPLRIALDIAAITAASYHNCLVDILIAIDADKTLSGNVFDINFLGDEIFFDQEDRHFIGGTVLLELIYRANDWRI